MTTTAKTIEKTKEIHQSGNIFQIQEQSKKVKQLPSGNYTVFSTMSGVFIQKIDGFKYPSTIYNFEQKLIDRIVRYYQSEDKNLGIFLSGMKGTGKTITSKLIVQSLDIPCFIIDENNIGMVGYLNENCEFPIIIFIDEFEKLTEEIDGKSKITELLTIMDGSATNNWRRVFLFTSNTQGINEDYLRDRPSRIRYTKQFLSLNQDQIITIAENVLKEEYKTPEILEKLSKSISSLNYVTIDMVLELLKEVNIFGPNDDFLSCFNATYRNYVYHNYYIVEKDILQDLIKKEKVISGRFSHMKNCEELVVDEEDEEDELFLKSVVTKTTRSVYYFHKFIEDNRAIYIRKDYKKIVDEDGDDAWEETSSTFVEIIMIEEEISSTFKITRSLAF